MTMSKLIAAALVLATLAATPAVADRPFGSSSQGPPGHGVRPMGGSCKIPELCEWHGRVA